MIGFDQSYLEWNFRLLSLFGMWNPWYKSNGKRKLYDCYAIALLIFACITPSSGEIIHAWNSKNDIIDFTQHFTLVTAMVSTTIKIVNLWCCRRDIEIAIDILNWERRQACNRKFVVYRDEIITSTIRTCRLFSLIFIVMVFWYCFFSCGKDLLYHKGNFNKLSISPLLVFRSNQSTYYWMFFLVDKATVSYLAGCTACHDSFFVVFLMHAGAQLDLLKQRLEMCYNQFDDSRRNDFIEKYYKLYDSKIESVRRTAYEEMLLNPINELNTCIEHHQKIFRYVNVVQRIFNITLVLQFVTSLLIITMTGFQIFGETELSRNEFIDTINFLICALFQLFLYCWFGTAIMVKSESISLSAYKSKWYIADERFKKTVRIILLRGQIPIVFRAGAICTLSSDTFMNIISKCYSSMALLNRVNE